MSSFCVLCILVSNTYCVVFFDLFVFVLCLVYQMLPVSLDCPSLVDTSVSLTVYWYAHLFIFLTEIAIFEWYKKRPFLFQSSGLRYHYCIQMWAQTQSSQVTIQCLYPYPKLILGSAKYCIITSENSTSTEFRVRSFYWHFCK